MSLAKDFKMETLAMQKDIISKVLAARKTAGITFYQHIGYIYPEVIKHFREEKFDIREQRLENGLYRYTFLPIIDLNEDELKQAEVFVSKSKLPDGPISTELLLNLYLNKPSE